MINWKVRLRNKTFLCTFVPMVLALIYQILAALGITPSVAESEIEAVLMAIINVLALVGVVVDPTTSGVSDSDQAMTYTEPKED